MQSINHLRVNHISSQQFSNSLLWPACMFCLSTLLISAAILCQLFAPQWQIGFLASLSQLTFDFMPLILAVGIVAFLSDRSTIAIATVLGHYLLAVLVAGAIAHLLGVETPKLFGLHKTELGLVGGVISAMTVMHCHNLRHQRQTISTQKFILYAAFSSISLGLIIGLSVPYLNSWLTRLSFHISTDPSSLEFGVYGFLERLLSPFGLQHGWNSPFFFSSGSYTNPETLQTVTGEIPRYFNGDPSSGNLAGGYLIKMWGLPAAALAIWHAALLEKRKMLAVVMLLSVTTSFTLGVTEPIEIMFMFISPLLYLAHSFLCASAYFLCVTIGVKHGYSFSHGLLDFILLYGLSTKAYLIFIIGPAWSLLYYLLFKWHINKHKMYTSGPPCS